MLTNSGSIRTSCRTPIISSNLVSCPSSSPTSQRPSNTPSFTPSSANLSVLLAHVVAEDLFLVLRVYHVGDLGLIRCGGTAIRQPTLLTPTSILTPQHRRTSKRGHDGSLGASKLGLLKERGQWRPRESLVCPGEEALCLESSRWRNDWAGGSDRRRAVASPRRHALSGKGRERDEMTRPTSWRWWRHRAVAQRAKGDEARQQHAIAIDP